MSQNNARHSRRRPQRIARRAFTLLEIIVVVTIIALLATLVAPKLLQNIWKAKQKVAISEVSSIAQQVGLYMADQGWSTLPEDWELTALTEGDSPLLLKKDLIDPWGREYMIVIPGESGAEFDVVSFGEDGEPGGEGENKDVNNNLAA